MKAKRRTSVTLKKQQKHTECDMTQQTEPDRLMEELQDTLTRLYGPLLASRDLWKLLGYASPAAYRQASVRRRLPVVESR